MSTDEGIATVDPESGEPRTEARTDSRIGRFLGATSAGLVSARVNGSLLRSDQPWSTEVFLVQPDGSEQYVSSIDHDGAEVAALAYDPVSMTFAMAIEVPPPGVTDPNMCEPNGRVATVPLGSSTLADIPLPPAPDGRRWQASSLQYRLDGTLAVMLVDYPLDCDTGDWLGNDHWFVLHDGQFVPMTDPQEIEQAPGAGYAYGLSVPLIWNNDQRHRASLTAEDPYQPPTAPTTNRLDRRVEDFFTAWLAGDLETMRAMATDATIEALGTPPGIRFDLLWDDTCLIGSSGSGGCTVVVFSEDGSRTTYTVQYSESGDDISIDAVT